MFYVRIVVKCIIQEKDKILLVKESPQSGWRPGKWSLPGGKVDPKETFLDGIRRELEEETGLKAKPIRIFSIHELVAKIKPDEERLIHHFVIICKKTGGSLKKPDHHVGELKWVTKTEINKFSLNDYTEFYYPKMFKKYFKNKNIGIDMSFVEILNCYKNKKYRDWLNQ